MSNQKKKNKIRTFESCIIKRTKNKKTKQKTKNKNQNLPEFNNQKRTKIRTF